ncbi:hypothetical protein [Shimia ponticola]|uniref:hypothetical protein n=1 Tax=Shimia ponticola TaxID=2582893 RepID=UPI0011BF75DA|nr:hypothetical protein [Shimia ponticola]
MKNIVKTGVAVLCCAALAGCLGGGGSGGSGNGAGGSGGGGGGSLSNYEREFNRVNGTQATLTRLSGTASYTGQVSIRTDPNVQDSDTVEGDLNMDINFDAGANPISATATNFSGVVNGQQTDITGTLSTANAQNQVNAITATNTGVGIVTGMSVGLEGTLSDPNGSLSGDALMTLQGNFRGNNGAGVSGAAAVAIDPSSGPAVITGGTFYADRN